MTVGNYSSSAQSLRRDLGDTRFDELVQKASGQCYLCEDPLDLAADEVQKDHIDPAGGDDLANLYLAHRRCNNLKKDLPLAEAKVMIQFKRFCEEKHHEVTFDDIIDRYITEPKRQSVKIVEQENEITIVFSRNEMVRTVLMKDPSSQVKYFFIEVPISFFHNDVEVQPRRIVWEHAWHMAQDFVVHPVHEPSSCRIVVNPQGVGKLLQFDGQHKTAAQIILGRRTIQTKVYLNPPLPLMRTLIYSIQNKIVKLALTASVALDKLSVIMRDHWEKAGVETEAAFVKSVRSDKQRAVKKELFAAIYKAILDDAENKMVTFIQKKRARRGSYPLSMNNLTNLILKELVCQEPQEFKAGTSEDLRQEEIRNVVFLLNELAEQLLLNQKWDFSLPRGHDPARDHAKAQRFLTPGSVKYWAPILRKAINNRLGLDLAGQEYAPLLRKLSDDQLDSIRRVVNKLCEHPIWTDRQDPKIDGKLGENRPSASEELFNAGPPKGYATRLNAAYLVGLAS